MPALATEVPAWKKVNLGAAQHDAIVQGRRVRYIDLGRGAGPPVVLVHGTGGSWQTWLLNLNEIARHRRVIAIDLPGFGRSDPLEPSADIAAYADAVAALLDGLGIKRAVAVGHSLGGIVVLRLALSHPPLVGSLVIVNGGGVQLSPRRLALVTRSLFGVNVFLSRAALVRAVVRRPRLRRWLVSAALHDRDALTPELAAEMLTTFASPGLVAAVAAGARDDVADHVGEIACPVLLVWGRHDRLIPLRLAEALAPRLRDARLEVIDGAGHCPMIERPEEFNRLLTEFADERSFTLRNE